MPGTRRYLVTGGAGFIGRHFVARVLGSEPEAGRNEAGLRRPGDGDTCAQRPPLPDLRFPAQPVGGAGERIDRGKRAMIPFSGYRRPSFVCACSSVG